MSKLTKEQLQRQVVNGKLSFNVSTSGTCKNTPEDHKLVMDGILESVTTEAKEWLETSDLEVIVNILN